MKMKNIEIGRYDNPSSYVGWITCDNWVIFIDTEGKPSEPYSI
jgi:hypothetical protein